MVKTIKKKIPNKLGDCFEANGTAFLFDIPNNKLPRTMGEFPVLRNADDPEQPANTPKQWTEEGFIEIISETKNWRLIHATVLHQADNKPFAHAWIEGIYDDTEVIFDFTSNTEFFRKFDYQVEFYYRMRIPPSDYPDDWKGMEDKYHRFEYTIEEVNKKIDALKSKMHWGAWDFEVER